MLKFFTKQVNGYSDEFLFRATLNGRDDLFDILYNRYYKRLLYYFYRMLGNNNELARDFTQELFFKIINKADSFNEQKKFSTWVFSIAHNMCKNEYRSQEVRKNTIKTDQLDGFACEEEFQQSDNERLISEIYQQLVNLDEIHKTAFLMKYREGFDIKEISDILDLPIGTIKSRLYYTRIKIASKLNVEKED